MRPLFITFNLNVDGMQFASSADLLAHFGMNVGNLAFVYAMTNQIMGDIKYYRDCKAHIKDNFDILVFPAANNIGEQTDLLWLADILEKTRLPILIVGLGVQALFGKERFPIPPGTKRLIDILKERGTKIGVRGGFTRDFLGNLGFESAVITGCPSNFISPDPHLGKTLEPKYRNLSREVSSIALNLEYFRLESDKVKVCTGWLNDHAGALILQSDEEVFGLMRNDYRGRPEKAAWIAKYFLGSPSVPDLRKWLAKFGRIYCHIPSWMDYLRCLSLSVGSRFHGNILAIQSGIPAIVFPHDTRTLEMCETMLIPYVRWDSIKPGDTIERIVQGIEFSGAAFDERRRQLATVYRDLVEETGLMTSKVVHEICAEGRGDQSSPA